MSVRANPANALVGLVGLALAFGLAGCSGSVSFGGSAVKGSEVASQVSSELEARVGRAPEKVECPDDLDAEVGATTECILTDSGESYEVMIEVTSVDEENESVLFDIQVAEEPIS